MYCRNCRKWFPDDISICDSCGMPLVEDSNNKRTPAKAALVKVLAGVITVAIIGSVIFVGRKLNKQPQGDKKLTTVS